MSMVHEPLRYAHDEGHTDVCYTEDGSKFITCGADGDIRIWSSEENEDPIHNCIGEWALSVRQRGNNVYVATSSNDIQILTLPDGDRDGVLDRFVAPINHIAVGKNSNLIALAGEDMEVKLINLERMNKEIKVLSGLSGPCLSVAICPNSKMIAASSGDSKLRIWDIESTNLLKEIACFPKVNSFANAKILGRIDFDPIKGIHLAYPDKSNIVILNTDDWSQHATLNCDVTAMYSIVQYSPCGNYIAATSEEGDFVVWDASSQMVINRSKHPKSVSIGGLMWNPKENGQIAYTDIEGQLGVLSNCIYLTKTASESMDQHSVNEENNDNEDVFENINFEDDDDEDNENAISVEKLKRQHMESPSSELKNFDHESSRLSTPRPRTPEVPLQSHFMPSSTPEHLDPRYMCWNDVAVVRSYGNTADESATKSIEVEFHDSTFHNNMMMQNYQDYTMGSISKAALVVAKSSQLHVIPLAASSKEWTLRVEEHEEIILVAASENLVCFAMSNYMVRVCSIFGTQRAVFMIQGPIVSMVAFKNILMVAYHSSGVRKNDQCINVRLIKIEGYAMDVKDIGSALGPESTLTWMGFSDVGTPAMVDSLGILSLYPHICNTWIPFCDTTQGSRSISDRFFVTAVFESYGAVGGIKCKGTVYPGFIPRPTMCEIALAPLFAEAITDKTQMEMNLFTWSTLQVMDTDKKFKETALKTFSLAFKNELDERALEFIEMLSNPTILMLSIKLASRLNKRRLVEKLISFSRKLASETDSGVEELSTPLSTPEPAAIKPSHRKLNLSSAKYSKNKGKNSYDLTPEVQKTQNSTQVVSTPSENNDSIQTTSESVNTQESLFPEEPKNPFLKSVKKPTHSGTSNPLSLTDETAGVSYEKEARETRNGENSTSEKRKHSDPDSDKPKGKQIKLDCFKFTKRT